MQTKRFARHLGERYGLQCRAKGCTKVTIGLSPYCRPHRDKAKHYGHPEGRLIRQGEYASERGYVERVIRKHSEHPGIKAALAIISEMLAEAMANPSRSKAHEAMARLARQAVTPERILLEAASLYSFAQISPRALPDDERLTFAIGRAVAHIVSAPLIRMRQSRRKLHRVTQRVPRAAREGIGARLRRDLAPVLVRLHDEVMRRQDRTRQRRAAMAQPIHQPT